MKEHDVCNLVEQIALTVSTHQGYRVVTDSSRGLAKEIANVAADALLGPVTPEESDMYRDYGPLTAITKANAARRANLLALAKTPEERVTIEDYLTCPTWSVIKVDGETKATVHNDHAKSVRLCLIATLKQGK